jgi:hypothetical protein
VVCEDCGGGTLTPAADGKSAVFEAKVPSTNLVRLWNRGETRQVYINAVAARGAAPQPVLHELEAGSAVPLEFSAASGHTPDDVAAGYPATQPVDCTTLQAIGPLAPTEQPGKRHVTYAEAQGVGWYTYIWRTDKAWAGTCRVGVIRLTDGTERRAYVRFE